VLALLTMGEGWHNNHHHYMSSANQGFFWWEVDLSYYLIRFFQALGLVWEVRTPPEKIRRATISAEVDANATAPAPMALEPQL
jgi:stearoyl-CoA desaturase (delta-9 desaturase)